MWEAAELLLDPDNHRPEVFTRHVSARGPHHHWGECANCETPQEAETRSRSEEPKAWAHYDWVRSLGEGRGPAHPNDNSAAGMASAGEE